MLSLSTRAHRQLALVVLILLFSTLCSLHATSAMPMPPGPQSNGNTEARSQERALLHRGHENGNPGPEESGVVRKSSMDNLRMMSGEGESKLLAKGRSELLAGSTPRPKELHVKIASKASRLWDKVRKTFRFKSAKSAKSSSAKSLSAKSPPEEPEEHEEPFNIEIERSNAPGEHETAALLQNWDKKRISKLLIDRPNLGEHLEAEKAEDAKKQGLLNLEGQYSPQSSPEHALISSHGFHSPHGSPMLEVTNSYGSPKHVEEDHLLAGPSPTRFPDMMFPRKPITKAQLSSFTE
ncbi:hypothetical protein FA10DRAFT_292707 [Acaromyces ingoldii]|uniref:Uncharacterized protein n=1 Tax=Acaromyces ingoldii TaxID=215250 RepID=A0A316YRD4_9BASI|nr:hypothetical protein FA10DRAFT_292707 [Acaromyces ingoldii]PWN91937.1 hypothetical protein FA10DRAFT_292707 [Acaromyces ingoldii]